MNVQAVWDRAFGQRVLCPICLDRFNWRLADRYQQQAPSPGRTQSWAKIALRHRMNRTMRRTVLATAYRKCPNRFKQDNEPGDHYLPHDFGAYGRPLIVGLVGGTASGKTHLLTAMLGTLLERGLPTLGINAEPLDLGTDDNFNDQFVTRLFDERKILPPTPPDAHLDFTHAIIVGSTGGRKRVVAFFDVQGESLQRAADRERTRFVSAVDGLIFVMDPQMVLNQQLARDRAFNAMMSRLARVRGDRGKFVRVPASIAITKSDLIRTRYPVGKWLADDGYGETVDAKRVYDESKDAYVFLHQIGAEAWLRPVERCSAAALHFVSATGRSPENGVFVDPVNPRRALKPLLSLLAMMGVLGDSVVQGRVGVAPEGT